MKVSKKEQARRKAQFHIHMKVAKAITADRELFELGRNAFNYVLKTVPRSSNGYGQVMALCSDAARYFGVTPRSMQRLYAAYFGPQRPRAKRRRK